MTIDRHGLAAIKFIFEQAAKYRAELIVDYFVSAEYPDVFAERLQNNYFLGRTPAGDVSRAAYGATLARRSVDVSQVDNLVLDKPAELTDNP